MPGRPNSIFSFKIGSPHLSNTLIFKSPTETKLLPHRMRDLAKEISNRQSKEKIQINIVKK
jgi:hypothetical protein